MVVKLDTPATNYLDRIKKASGQINPNTGRQAFQAFQHTDNKMPNQLRYQNPNEHFTAQRALVDGVAPVSGTSRTNVDGLQERDMLTAETGDIATEKAEISLSQRRSQQQKMMDSFSGELGFESSWDDNNGYSGGGDGAGSGLSGEQLQNARLIANVGKQRGYGANEIQIALMTALAESGLRNVSHGDRDSVGLFQQRTSQGWGSIQQIMDPTYSAGKFYDALGKSARGANPWNTAQNVQRSAFANGSNYQAQWGLAQKAFNALNGAPASGGTKTSISNNPGLSSWINANNNKYIDMDGYYGAQCVDLYSKYTSSFVGGRPKPVGYAPEIFNNYDTSVYTRFDKNQAGRPGDVVVWGKGTYTPLGHVAVVVGDNGNGTLRVLQSNATAAGSAGNSIISNMSKSALLGYLRPNKLMGR